MNASIPTSLTDGLDAIIEMDAPLAAHTWFGVGGNADMLVRPQSEAALKELLRRCHSENKTVRVLGSGANLLVLDEGVDVPDASVGLVLGGTGSNREYVQRLGRLLRKKEGKTARLIEIISKETMEVGTSRRRHQKTGGAA